MNKVFYFLFLAALIVSPLSALAHEHQELRIGGKVYEFTVGSLNEPVTVDDKTGVDLAVKDDKGQPVTGLEQTLKVELSAGGKTKTLDLRPRFGVPGGYSAPFYPTVQTTYAYRVFGTVNNTEVNLTFTCNPAGHPATPEDNSELKISEGVSRIHKAGAFGCPVAKADMGFPEQSASIYELDAQLSDLAPTTRNFTMLAIALGLLGTVLGGVALFRKK